jgi:sirohydrochlorin ferrochelatase
LAALVLIAHGSKNPKFQEVVFRVADALEKKAGKVYVGFLRGEPSVRAALTKAFQESDVVIIVPFFISEGSHVVEDLREEVEKSVNQGKKVIYACALGDHPLIIEALFQRYQEALLGKSMCDRR